MQYIRPYWHWMVAAVVALIVGSLLGLVLPLVVRNLVDFVLVHKDFNDLNRMTLGLLVVFILQAAFGYVQQITLARVGERAVADIRIDVYTHLQGLPLSFYAEQRTGALVSRVTNDVSLLQQTMTWNLATLFQQAIMIIGAAALLFWLNWQLTLLILLIVPVITLTMVWLGNRIRVASVAVQDSLAEVANAAEETTRGVRIVKSFAREPYEIGRFTSRVLALYRAAMNRARTNALLSPIIGFVGSITITGILYLVQLVKNAVLHSLLVFGREAGHQSSRVDLGDTVARGNYEHVGHGRHGHHHRRPGDADHGQPLFRQDRRHLRLNDSLGQRLPPGDLAQSGVALLAQFGRICFGVGHGRVSIGAFDGRLQTQLGGNALQVSQGKLPLLVVR